MDRRKAHKGTKTSDKDQTSAGRPSVKLDERNIPNPYFNKVLQIADSPEYEFIMGLVGDKTEEEEMELLASNPDVMEALYSMIDRFEAAPLVPATMPPAPHALKLYSRTSDDAYVADIGSGDGNKAAKSQSKITCYDVLPGEEKVHYLDADREKIPEVDVLTSYNVLTQLENPSRLLERDSLHVFPDIDYIVTATGAECVGERKYKTVLGEKEFIDYDHALPGDEISEGYKCITGYAAAALDLTITPQPVIDKPFTVPIRDTKIELAGPATPKYDGTALRLTFAGGTASLTARNGKGVVMGFKSREHYCKACKCHYAGSSCFGRRCSSELSTVSRNTRLPKDFILFMEQVKSGGKEHYILLRVPLYGRMVPFHGLENLRNFCERIKISINGVPLQAPGSPGLGLLPADGLIYRHNFMDYRLKEMYTVDLKNVRRFVQAAYRKGFVVEVDSSVDFKLERMREYYLTTDAGVYYLRFCRSRPDKTTETDYSDIGYIMDMATPVDGSDFSSTSVSIVFSDDTYTEG